MSLDVDVASDGTRSALGRARTGQIARRVLHAEGVRHALLSVTYVSKARIAQLNRRHLRHRGATDVISFAFTRARRSDPVIGDVYIAPEIARANARENRVPLREELARLVVHGILHVLGYDHPAEGRRERSAMWRRQERLVKEIGA